MKIRIAVDLDDRTRKAISTYRGETGKASRDTCRKLIEALIEADLATIAHEHGTE